MAKEKFPTTQAIRTLREHGLRVVLHPYKYRDKGGAGSAAEELGVDEHFVVKTLVMQDDKNEPFLVLMHGDKAVSTKNLARTLGLKTVTPCEPQSAQKHTGYLVGGISPFGTKRPLQVYAEASIVDLTKIYINAGRRGLMAELSPKDMVRVLDPTLVTVAV
jgi:Cys-tRNA(Pro) deacylase